MADVDTDVLIIGAGSSGIGMAIQLQRKLGHQNFTIVEKGTGVGGTWFANTYPGGGCDVASHFYSYSFALNPDWNKKYSMQPEIQSYFAHLATQHNLPPKIRFRTTVDTATWTPASHCWTVTVTDHATGTTSSLTARAIVSGVGALSVPRECTIPGASSFQGRLFHSAQWDSSFHWSDKSVVVLGNGCSATQFVPILTSRGPGTSSGKAGPGGRPVRQLTQFSRQAHYLSERENPDYGAAFKAVMRYVPLAMRLYRLKVYMDMERDFASFYTKGGQGIRNELKVENEKYVKRMAPERYWDALIPKHEIGCKRKVLDTDYLESLWRPNMELVPDDPVERVVEDGIVTRSGRKVKADAIVLATGFETKKMLFPMKIVGDEGLSLEEHWDKTTSGSPAAYMGTLTTSFPNFFILMGPNTVTGHLSVIYTVECQILLTLALLKPILRPSSSLISRLLPATLSGGSEKPTTISVTKEAAERDIGTTHNMLKDFVWSSGCTSWALDPKTGTNIAMYPHYQWHYWLRCLFARGGDFTYGMTATRNGKLVKTGERNFVVGFGWTYLRRAVLSIIFATTSLVAYREAVRRRVGVADLMAAFEQGWRSMRVVVATKLGV